MSPERVYPHPFRAREPIAHASGAYLAAFDEPTQLIQHQPILSSIDIQLSSLRTMSTLVSRLFLMLVATLSLSFVDVSTAYAHNTLVSSNPADGEVVALSPTEWILTFDKTVPLSSASGEVVKNDGVRVALSQPRHGNTDNIIVFNLPADLTNLNTARWRLVGTDGHVISGRVNFSVGAANGVSPSTTNNNNVAPPMESSGDEGSVVAATSRGVLRALNYLGILLLIGILFSDWYTTRGLLATTLGTRVASLSAQGIAITATLQFGMFVNDARMLGTSFFQSFFDALSTTPGSMMGLKAVTGVVLAVLMAQTMNRAMAQQRLITTSMAMYLMTFAYVGHSRSEAAPWLGIPLNMIHTIAMSVWLGGLAVLVFIVVPRLDTGNALTAFQRFGSVAEKAVITLSVTGLIQLLRMYTNPLDIFTSVHGLLLVLKLCIVAGMIYLASKNRQSLIDSLNQEGRAARLTRRNLMQLSLIEIGLGTAILVVTAILVGLSPA